METVAAGWNASAQLRRVGWFLHAELVEIKGRCLARAIRAKFDPNQPRVPAGNPDGGEWTGTGGGGTPGSASRLSAPNESAPRNGVQLAGGFTAGDEGLTVQSFVSANCLGLIHRVLPSQFLDMTIGEVMAAAKGGDVAARSCIKLLRRDDYRK